MGHAAPLALPYFTTTSWNCLQSMQVPADDVLKDIWESRVASYVWVSGLVLLACDTISTFPREAAYFNKPMNASSDTDSEVIQRYKRLSLYVLIQSELDYSWTRLTSLQRCRLFFWFNVTVGSNTALLTIVNAILVVRLYALYGHSVKVLSFLVSIFSGEIAVQIYTIIKFGSSIANTSFVPSPGTPILGCLTAPNLRGDGVTIGWVVSIIGAVIYFFMTVAKFYQSAVEARRCGYTMRFPPLAKAFIRDGTVYFLVIVVALVAGDLSALFVPGPFVALYEPWMAASLIVAALGYSSICEQQLFTKALSATLCLNLCYEY
ncbi:hypothetical protein CPB84DRAFT_1844584 [Gymnopilus junonius]|uniref:Uncharacterized protein n=1 Tax=Gymnopilus junonius TaxID=109634 RepID=A0A9P5NTA4_GYMJU|nr:hypothetical protein CPB84DRAFT_1844584 [Gymnopilus junonius]